jgi:hypothetical protein
MTVVGLPDGGGFAGWVTPFIDRLRRWDLTLALL